ncbi:MAG: hypothetical protein ACRCVN_02270 [Spirochaetia bacterium]
MAKKVVFQSKATGDVLEPIVEDIKKVLFEAQEDLILDLSMVEKIDVAGIQLILVTLRDGLKSAKDVSFEDNVAKEVLQKFMMGGFISPDVKDGKGLKVGLLSLID